MTDLVVGQDPGDPHTRPTVSFADHLAAAHGRPMERALIRARQRYNAAKPSRQRLSRIHRAYAQRKR